MINQQSAVHVQPNPDVALPKALAGRYSPIINRIICLSRTRAEGLLYGIAVGDALGLPVETYTQERIREAVGSVDRYLPIAMNPFYSQSTLPIGMTSDDLQLTAAIFDALSDAKGYSRHALYRQHVLAMQESTAGWGGATKVGVMALEAGGDPNAPEFANQIRPGTGNGIPMKVGALAAHLAQIGGDDSLMLDMVGDLCKISHPTAISASAGLAHIAALLYCFSCTPSDFCKEEFVKQIVRASALGAGMFPQHPVGDDVTSRLQDVGRFAKASSDDIIAAFGAGSCYVHDSLPFSYAFFLRNPFHFRSVIDVINAGGDTDSNGAFVAGLQGALLGKEYIPKELLSGLQGKDRIGSTCERFFRSFDIEE